jgi:hypothetical protein
MIKALRKFRIQRLKILQAQSWKQKVREKIWTKVSEKWHKKVGKMKLQSQKWVRVKINWE